MMRQRVAHAGGAARGALAFFADVASLLGGARWQGAVLAAPLTPLVTMRRAADRRRAAVFTVGVACVLAVVAAAVVAAGRAPWSAWNHVASRPVLVLSERGAVARFIRDTTLEFAEAHHVVALRDGTFRVAEQVGARTLVREWLARNNDVLTLLGGAVALVPPWTRGVRGPAPIVPLVCEWAAVCCGIYAVASVAELVLADVPAAALIGAACLTPASPSWTKGIARAARCRRAVAACACGGVGGRVSARDVDGRPCAGSGRQSLVD